MDSVTRDQKDHALDRIHPIHFLNQQGSLFPFAPQTLDEVVWPSQNEAGIPELDSTMQAAGLVQPVNIWGAIPRSKPMPGTYLFYTEDYRFTRLWRRPEAVVESGCQVVVEANFSVRPRMPFPVAIYEIFRKRWLSRYWQSQGLRIIVDMNVAPYYMRLNLLGVPPGWRSYAMRVHTGERDILGKVYQLCCQHADTSDILFVVYGGGHWAENICLQNDWTWVAETMDTDKQNANAETRRQAMGLLRNLWNTPIVGTIASKEENALPDDLFSQKRSTTS